MDPITLLSAIPGAGPLVPWIISAGVVAAALATVLPHPAAAPATRGARIYTVVYAGIAWLGLNFGNARNVPPAA